MIEQGQHEVRALLQKADGTAWELDVIGDLSITMGKNAATSLSGTLFRRGEINVAGAESVIVLLDGKPFIWGYIDSISGGEEYLLNFSATDQIKFLVKNERTQNYGALTLTEFTKRVLADLMVNNFGTFDESEHVLPEIVMQQTKVLDAITDCINKTFEATGKKFFLLDEAHLLYLRSQESMIIPETEFMLSVFNTGSITWGEDVTDVYTAVKAYSQRESEDGQNTYQVQDDSAVARYGFMLKEITVQDGEDITTVAVNTLSEVSAPKKTLSVSNVTGDMRVRPGSVIYVDLYSYNDSKSPDRIVGWFEVDSCSHSLSGGTHFMNMDLTEYRG